MIIAIDGPGGVGKSTVARGVARSLGLPYLDTGATYRCAALAALRAGADPHDAGRVFSAVARATITFRSGRAILDGDDVTREIRSPEVTRAVTPVSAMAEVRHHCVSLQRQWVAGHGDRAVVEGRDIGTVVFPDASVKVFLTARPEIRAARRAGDAETTGQDVAAIAAALAHRDAADAGRDVAPMKPASDAVTIDTSELSIDEVIGRIVSLAGGAGALRPE
jgi:cytidylate kinase